MSKAHALVVDDETDILDLLKITLARMDIQAQTATTVAEAKRLLERGRFDLCLTDMNLPDGSGIDLINHISHRYPELPVAMITAYGNMESAVAAMKAGAFDFVAKPVDLQLLRRLVGAALRLYQAGPDGTAAASDGPRLLGSSPVMGQIRHMIKKLARNQAPVFITGESGTGKELAARLIHAQGPRSGGAFVAVNCGAIPQDLVESELFGHRKGSFTGAVADKEGLFQTADGGTLFLDEVADLPAQTQVKLLRAIQEKRIRPVGAQHEVPVDTRIISASHRDLNQEVSEGRFRQDLFYRINVIELRMPALRERQEDIPELARHMLERIAGQAQGDGVTSLSAGALDALARYPFPGNVRELENILERATALSEGTLIELEDLYLPEGEQVGLAGGSAGAPVTERVREPLSDPATDPAGDAALDDSQPLEDYLGEIEKRAIIAALDETRWNRTAAAKKLGMTLRSLRYRLAKLGIE